jgi:hypothetical protein
MDVTVSSRVFSAISSMSSNKTFVINHSSPCTVPCSRLQVLLLYGLMRLEPWRMVKSGGLATPITECIDEMRLRLV